MWLLSPPRMPSRPSPALLSVLSPELRDSHGGDRGQEDPLACWGSQCWREQSPEETTPESVGVAMTEGEASSPRPCTGSLSRGDGGRGGQMEARPGGWPGRRGHVCIQGLFWDVCAPSKDNPVSEETMAWGGRGGAGIPSRPGLHFSSCQNPRGCDLPCSKQLPPPHPHPNMTYSDSSPLALPLCPEEL